MLMTLLNVERNIFCSSSTNHLTRKPTFILGIVFAYDCGLLNSNIESFFQKSLTVLKSPGPGLSNAQLNEGLRTLQIYAVGMLRNNKSTLESGNNFKTDSPFTIVAKQYFTSKIHIL